MQHAEEQPLGGGNVNEGVVRIGDTVRRPTGPWTPAVHALLTHLHEVGFRAAPRPLGIDEQGREVLTFMSGQVVWPDRFSLLDPSRQLARVARLFRGFHDAVQDFTPPPDARWQGLIPAEGSDIIAHHDLAPWNLVVGGEGQWAFMDWDGAGPGSRLWDIAYAIHGFIPLSADPAWQRPDAADRSSLGEVSERGEDHEDLVAVVSGGEAEGVGPAANLSPSEPSVEVLQPHPAARGGVGLLQAHFLSGGLAGLFHQCDTDATAAVLTLASAEAPAMSDPQPSTRT